MHLTRVPADETDLLAYWQFNRSSGHITDRVGTNHASLIGGAGRTTSTAPVGPGASTRLEVSAGGTYDFSAADLSLVFPVDGTTFPEGELCVTRINHAPDQLPTDDVSESYWIVHNYGNNSTFDELTSMTFSNLLIKPNQAADPSLIQLFKRGSNAYGNTWGNFVDEAETATAGEAGQVIFSEGNGQTSFSQFIMGFAAQPLDAELIHFRAHLNPDRDVELNWISASEENLDYYEVQRSQSGLNFDKLTTVAAAGDSFTEQHYSALDRQPSRGINYYRLKMVDRDGSVTYSEIKSILIEALADQVVVYPNPLPRGQQLMVKTMISTPFSLRLYAADGELVRNFAITGDAQLDLGDLPTGIYSYSIEAPAWKTSGLLVLQ